MDVVRNECRGAGVYGAPAPTHVTACVNSRNPFGHNPECPCGWNRRELAEIAAMSALEADLATHFEMNE